MSNAAANRPTRIYLVRHGETDWVRQGRLQGREDVPLNDAGIQQSMDLVPYFAQCKGAVIVSSPLSRTMETARIIAEQAGIDEVHAEPDLIERDYGKASGLTLEERNARYPDKDFEGMEPLDALMDRVYGALLKTLARYQPRDIIIVSHGGAINAILAKVSQGEIGSGKTRLKVGCVSMLECADGQLSIAFYNQTASELIT